MDGQLFSDKEHIKSENFELFHYKCHNNDVVDYHNHDLCEIIFFVSGKVTYIIEGKSYNLKPGDILLINNKELHKPIIERDTVFEKIFIWINPDFIKKLCTPETDLLMCFKSAVKNKSNLLRPEPKKLAVIKNTLFELEKACSNNAYGNQILKNILLIELMIYINRAYLEADTKTIEKDVIYDSKVNEIIHYINQNLSEDLSLESLSKKFYISKYHLLRQFKKHTGYTLHSYIHQKRLLTAKELLKEGMRIAVVCQKCGFNDYSNFIRMFSRAFNISPKKYSKQFTNLD